MKHREGGTAHVKDFVLLPSGIAVVPGGMFGFFDRRGIRWP
jgi:hypothetical protein